MSNNRGFYFGTPNAYIGIARTSALTGVSAIWVPEGNKTYEKIQGFVNLPNGWHYGDGVAPSQTMIDTASAWNVLLGGSFPKTDAFPGVAGEIILTAYYKNHYVEILIEDDGVGIIYERDGREINSIDAAANTNPYFELQRIVRDIWNSSGYSIRNTLTVSSSNLSASHSKTQDRARPLFKSPALTHQDAQFAITSGDIIQMSGESLQFFLSSTTENSPQIHT